MRRPMTMLFAGSMLLITSCGGDDSPSGPSVPPLAKVLSITESTGVDPTGISASVDAFRTALGGANNGNAVGSQPDGRREITWDAGDADSAPSYMPADFYNAIAPRGVILGGDARLYFQQSADISNATTTPVEFGNLNSSYPTAFAPFSSPRLFSALGNTTFEVRFYVPGTLTPAAVSGFGAVFCDVDVTGSSKLEFIDAQGRVVFSRDILATPGNASLSFLGATFDSAAIAKVRVTAGNGVIGPNDVTQGGTDDMVVLDNFIYGEPVAR